jgi:hypothetical protein
MLSGLVYCHRISNTQMAATSVRHLRTFEELCGKNALQNVILATTMWDEVDEETGIMEEERMKTKYWNKMLERRSTTGRFTGTYESALQLLQPLIDAASFKRRNSLLLQQEMVDMGKQLTETSAGRHLFSKAQHIVSQRQHVIERIQIEMRRPVGDRTSLQPLHEEHQKLSQSLESTFEEMRVLKPPVVRFLETSERWLFQKWLVLRLRLVGPGKVGQAVNCVESEASPPASCSKELFKELPELPFETEAELDSGQGYTVSREVMVSFEPFKELFEADMQAGAVPRLVGLAKVGEAVDCLDSEASPPLLEGAF